MNDTDRLFAEYEEDPDGYEADEYEWEYEDEYEVEYEQAEDVLDEAEEMELAAELLEATDDDEVKRVVDKAMGRKNRKLARSPRRRGALGKFLGRAFKGLAGGAATVLGGPVVGGAVRRLLGDRELEGLSAEDQEFEGARRMVRLCRRAAEEASEISPAVGPRTAAKAAVTRAVREEAPELLRRKRRTPSSTGGQAQRGEWVRDRRRRAIILHNV